MDPKETVEERKNFKEISSLVMPSFEKPNDEIIPHTKDIKSFTSDEGIEEEILEVTSIKFNIETDKEELIDNTKPKIQTQEAAGSQSDR